jgi:hypothetical protein
MRVTTIAYPASPSFYILVRDAAGLIVDTAQAPQGEAQPAAWARGLWADKLTDHTIYLKVGGQRS